MTHSLDIKDESALFYHPDGDANQVGCASNIKCFISLDMICLKMNLYLVAGSAQCVMFDYLKLFIIGVNISSIIRNRQLALAACNQLKFHYVINERYKNFNHIFYSYAISFK